MLTWFEHLPSRALTTVTYYSMAWLRKTSTAAKSYRTNMPSLLPYCYLVPKSTYVTPLLNDLHWLRIEKRIIFITLLYVYKSLNGLCPQNITDCLVVKRPPTGSVTTRSCHGLDLLIPKTIRRSGDRAYSVAAATLWTSFLYVFAVLRMLIAISLLSRHIYLSNISFSVVCLHLYFACFFMFCCSSAL